MWKWLTEKKCWRYIKEQIVDDFPETYHPECFMCNKPNCNSCIVDNKRLLVENINGANNSISNR